MEIKEKGRYRLLKNIKTRSSIGIAEITAGTEITITQIDSRSRNVIGPDLMDWVHWDLPVEKVDK